MTQRNTLSQRLQDQAERLGLRILGDVHPGVAEGVFQFRQQALQSDAIRYACRSWERFDRAFEPSESRVPLVLILKFLEETGLDKTLPKDCFRSVAFVTQDHLVLLAEEDLASFCQTGTAAQQANSAREAFEHAFP